MTINAIKSDIQALQALAAQAKGQAPQAMTRNAGFAGELQSSIGKINQMQQQASSKARRFQLGEPGLELSEVMADMQKAGLAFQMGTQVRNRVVSAYKEIMNMPV